jgi:galactokinase
MARGPRRPAEAGTLLTAGFRTLFGTLPAATADAPGRVNLIGEHTDYNDGFVLPIAIPQRTRVDLSPRADRTVRAASAAMNDGVEEYRLGEETRGRGWLDYVQGCTRALADAGHPLRGFDAWIGSRVPVGSGLSSSAALEVALLRALRAAFGLALDDVALALVGQRAEVDFVGARVGVMDQMASSLADERSALFLDTRSLAWERVALPAAVELVVIDSGVTHAHATGGYNERRAECEAACAALGLASLRDIDAVDAARIAALPEPLGRRVRHVRTENARVLAAVEALRAGDVATLGALLRASHDSLRDDYAVSVPEVDTLVALANEHTDVLGARLTGGGFGGCVVVLTRAGAGRTVSGGVAARYASATGRQAVVHVPEAR